jgi:hypothetical protein
MEKSLRILEGLPEQQQRITAKVQLSFQLETQMSPGLRAALAQDAIGDLRLHVEVQYMTQ